LVYIVYILVVQVREQMQSEIEKYKHETEEAVNRTIGDMRAALEARLKEKIQLENERDRMEALVAQLQGQVNELQAQVSVTTLPICGRSNWAKAASNPRGNNRDSRLVQCFSGYSESLRPKQDLDPFSRVCTAS